MGLKWSGEHSLLLTHLQSALKPISEGSEGIGLLAVHGLLHLPKNYLTSGFLPLVFLTVFRGACLSKTRLVTHSFTHSKSQHFDQTETEAKD